MRDLTPLAVGSTRSVSVCSCSAHGVLSRDQPSQSNCDQNYSSVSLQWENVASCAVELMQSCTFQVSYKAAILLEVFIQLSSPLQYESLASGNGASPSPLHFHVFG